MKLASIKKKIVKGLKECDFDEEEIEAILKAYGDRIYFKVMRSQLPADEFADRTVLGLLDLLDAI